MFIKPITIITSVLWVVAVGHEIYFLIFGNVANIANAYLVKMLKYGMHNGISPVTMLFLWAVSFILPALVMISYSNNRAQRKLNE